MTLPIGEVWITTMRITRSFYCDFTKYCAQVDNKFIIKGAGQDRPQIFRSKVTFRQSPYKRKQRKEFYFNLTLSIRSSHICHKALTINSKKWNNCAGVCVAQFRTYWSKISAWWDIACKVSLSLFLLLEAPNRTVTERSGSEPIPMLIYLSEQNQAVNVCKYHFIESAVKC